MSATITPLRKVPEPDRARRRPSAAIPGGLLGVLARYLISGLVAALLLSVAVLAMVWSTRGREPVGDLVLKTIHGVTLSDSAEQAGRPPDSVPQQQQE